MVPINWVPIPRNRTVDYKAWKETHMHLSFVNLLDHNLPLPLDRALFTGSRRAATPLSLADQAPRSSLQLPAGVSRYWKSSGAKQPGKGQRAEKHSIKKISRIFTGPGIRARYRQTSGPPNLGQRRDSRSQVCVNPLQIFKYLRYKINQDHHK